MTEEEWDAVVVGAGPAGSAAAIMLARAGQRVLLLDRHSFPRDKPCGDLIGVRALIAARRLGVDEEILAGYPRLAGAYLTATAGALDLTPSTRAGRALLARSDARVIPRVMFDAAMVRAAQRAGAKLRRLTVREVGTWDGMGRMVSGTRSDGDIRLRAQGVVLAGGYGCRVAADVAPLERHNRDQIAMPTRVPEPSRGIAMRGYFRNVAAPNGRISFCLDDWVLPGYGWVFPLPGGGANVGVGTLTRGGASEGEHLRSLYSRFTENSASPAAPWLSEAQAEGPARSWPLDLGPRRRRLTADGLLVAGEAAALVGPLTGAGIAFALETGAAAGTTLAAALAAGDPRAGALASYARTTRRRALPWLRAEHLAQRWLSDPSHLGALVSTIRPLPPTGVLGARLLLHLG